MSGILMAVALLLVLAYALLRGKLKKAKPMIELHADEQHVKTLDLQPGELVRMVPNEERKEVMVFTTRTEEGEKLGAINNGFIYKNVVRRFIEARVAAIQGGRIMLEITKTQPA
jgi:hypothetical protein